MHGFFRGFGPSYANDASELATWRPPPFCSVLGNTTGGEGKGGHGGEPSRNNAGLEKLKKRGRRATITSDVSRPNDRHLSRRSRCYAKSPLPFGDSARTASESYKQTVCLRFSFPVSPSSFLSLVSPLSFPLFRSLVAASKPERVDDVLRKQGQLSSPRIYECLRIFRGGRRRNLWPPFRPRIIIVPVCACACPRRKIMQILGTSGDERVGLKKSTRLDLP